MMWAWAAWTVIMVLVSCAAYKAGYMQASIMADAKWAKLVEENRQLREQNIKNHWRQEYPE